MKTRMLAIALERGRVGERSVQACGLVSRTMTRREGEVPAEGQIGILGVLERLRTFNFDLVVV